MRNRNTSQVPRRWIVIKLSDDVIPLIEDGAELQPVVDPTCVMRAQDGFVGLIQMSVSFCDEDVSDGARAGDGNCKETDLGRRISRSNEDFIGLTFRRHQCDEQSSVSGRVPSWKYVSRPSARH